MAKKYFLTYGTLRKNSDRNHNFGRHGDQKYLGETWINGYRLYHLGGYPAAVKGVGQIFCEVHEVDDETFRYIDGMEQGAGYHTDEHDVELQDGKVRASLWAMPDSLIKRYGATRRIPSGDWNDREAIG